MKKYYGIEIIFDSILLKHNFLRKYIKMPTPGTVRGAEPVTMASCLVLLRNGLARWSARETASSLYSVVGIQRAKRCDSKDITVNEKLVGNHVFIRIVLFCRIETCHSVMKSVSEDEIHL